VGDRIKVEGFVEKIFVKEGQSARGPWKAYSIKVQRASGDVDARFYQFGFDAPAFKEGDYIAFEADVKDEKAAQFVKGSGTKPKNPPQRPAKPAAAGGPQKGGYAGKGGGYKPREPINSKVFGKIGGNNTEDDIRRMSYTAARSAAIEAVLGLLAHDGLPMSSAKTKAGQASRYEEITAAIDKLTVEYFYDAALGRKLESVADAGSKESRIAPLPTEEPSKGRPAAESSETVGGGPPEDDDVQGDEPETEQSDDDSGSKF
jgi:hypothetical protein